MARTVWGAAQGHGMLLSRGPGGEVMGVVLLGGVGVTVHPREWADGELEWCEEAQVVWLQVEQRGQGEVVLGY